MQRAEPSSGEKNQILIRLSESPAVDYGKVAYDKQSENQRVFSAIWGSRGVTSSHVASSRAGFSPIENQATGQRWCDGAPWPGASRDVSVSGVTA
jgi:hypothetical protein